MIKTVIVDDEPKSRKTLKTLLSRHTNNIDVLSEANNVANGIAIINKLKPQLVFLDISMPDGNGFDLLENCSHSFEIIFTTAYTEYVISALRAKAADYLLKPINIDELQKAVKVVEENIIDREKITTKYTLLQRDLKTQTNKIAIATVNGHEFIDKENILFLEAKGSYTQIMCIDERKIISSKSLKQFEEALSSNLFFRTHNSYIVNLSHVKYFNQGDGFYIKMSNNSCIALARRKRKDFLALFSI
ncbi:MAG: LytTR family DNA-binding domain-containing protein [Flavipsychrobacter sp.]